MKKIFILVAATLCCIGAYAACVGTSTEGNQELCGEETCIQWTKGYEWTLSTNDNGNVVVAFNINEDLGENPAPEIYCKKGDNVTWTPAIMQSTRIGTILTGFSTGDGITLALKITTDDGKMYSKYIGYIVGDDCADAGCIGHHTDEDFDYKSLDAEWTKGYNYVFKTTDQGVLVTFEVLDTFSGMANPILIDLTDPSLPKEITMTLVGNKAFTTVTGYNDGDVVNVLMKMTLSNGLIYTRRIGYVVGSDCSEWTKACGGHSTEADPVYYAGDPTSQPWTKGYDYGFTTDENGNVLIRFNLTDKSEGMNSPILYMFDGAQETEKAAEMYGIGAYYEMTGVTAGQEIEVMLKMAVSGGVLWSERLKYTVGAECGTGVEESKVAESIDTYPNPVTDILYINAEEADIEVYSLTGTLVATAESVNSINISTLATGSYIAKVYTADGASLTKKIIKQ